MIDIRFLRENPDIVKQNIKNKFQDDKLPLVDEVIEFDAKSRQAKQDADALRATMSVAGLFIAFNVFINSSSVNFKFSGNLTFVYLQCSILPKRF